MVWPVGSTDGFGASVGAAVGAGAEVGAGGAWVGVAVGPQAANTSESTTASMKIVRNFLDNMFLILLLFVYSSTR
jgi:hypothetical protein